MKKHILLLTLFFTIFFSCNAQKDCEKILNKKIDIEAFGKGGTSALKALQEFEKDFKEMMLCQYDSIDYIAFNGPNGGLGKKMLGSILIEVSSSWKEADEKEITLKKIKEHIDVLRNRSDYPRFRKVVIARMKLMNKKACLKNWEEDKELLLEMGIDDETLKLFKDLVTKNEGKSYKEIFPCQS